VTEAQIPQAATFRRYGMTREEWVAILDRQGGVCGVCGKLPRSGRLNTDHQHVRGWAKLPPEVRKQFVRGLACFRCNVALRGGTTVAWLEGALAYLAAYERRAK